MNCPAGLPPLCVLRPDAATAPALARLAASALSAGGAWCEDDLRALATRGLAVADDGLAEGLILLGLAADEAEILDLGVVPAARRRGLARALLDMALAEAARRGARTAFLEVAEDNAPARALYARAGFAEVGRRPAYYGRTDALVLRRPLA
ncbi:MAG: GNAT family N-acetyltransferase [Pseudomonadota bacterium]